MALQVGSAYSLYNLDISPMRASVAEAKRLLADLEAAARRVSQPQSAPALPNTPRAPAVPSNAPDLDRETAAARRAADEAIRLAQAKARLSQAARDQSGALATLNSALANSGQASERARLGLQTQIAQLQHGTTYAQQFGSAMNQSLTNIIGPAALAAGAFATLKGTVDSFVDAFKFKAQLDANNAAITAQLKGVRDSNQAFAEARRFGEEYKLTQQEITSAMQTSVGVMRKSQSSVEDIFSTLARLRMMSPEQSIENAALALKELQNGDITSIVTRFEIARSEANKMKAEIKGGADAVQVLSKYLNDNGMTMEALKVQTQGAAGALKDLAIAQEQLKLAQAEMATGPGMRWLERQTEATRGLTRVLNGEWRTAWQGAINQVAEGDSFFRFLANATGQNTQALEASAQRMRETGDAAGQLNGMLGQVANGSVAQAVASQASAQGSIYQSQAMVQAAEAGKLVAATIAEAQAEILKSAEASVIDAAQKEAQTAQTQLLQAQSLAAANAFMQLNPQIDAAGVASLIAAGKIDPLIAQLVAARVQADAARAALIAFNNAQNTAAVNQAVANNRASGRMGRGDSSDYAQQDSAWTRINAEREKAERDQIMALGTHADKVALLNKEYGEAVKMYGAYSSAAIEAETKLRQAEQAQIKSGRTGAGGGGSKISAAQRLNGQLSDIQTSADNKAEDEELKHAKNLHKIYADYAKKRLEAEQQYRQAGLDSRADFYEQLGSIESHELQRELSARYEALKLESDKIAQEQGADAAERYLEAGRQAIQKQAQLREEIRKAEEGDENGEGKDAAKAEYLRGVLAEREKADQARLDSIKASGSAVANEHQRQLNDEMLRYEEANGKIADSAERAAEKKITQAQRSTKATAEENAELQKQVSLYQQIGKSPPTAADALNGGQGAPVVAPASVNPTTNPTSAASQIMAVLDQAVVDALNAQTATLAGKLDEVVGAVKSLAPRLEAVERAVRAAKNGVG